jgi:hypothetical protein
MAHFPESLQLLPNRLVSKAKIANTPVKRSKLATAF